MDGEINLIETKADKQPFGFSEMMRPFTNHQMRLLPNDRLFLFSDGFVDQFGGEKGKNTNEIVSKHSCSSITPQTWTRSKRR
jgi:serine phosphatase RsbU (regulator of sigma subunit)